MRLSTRLVAGATLVATIIGGMLTVRSHRVSLASVDHIVTTAQMSGTTGLFVFASIQVGVAALGILPASLLAVGAGVAYGFWLGALISAASTIFGGWLAFVLARSILRPWIERFVRHGVGRRFDDAVTHDGWKFVCLMRVSPLMPFAATSYGLGLTSIGHRAFLLGTLASMPALMGYVAAGACAKAGLAFGRHEIGLLHGAMVAAGAIATVLVAMRICR